MNTRFQKYMAPAGDGEAGAPGEASVDYGNDVTPSVDTSVEDAAATAAAEEAAAAEKAAADAKPDTPRDETGKFAKKEKDDGPLIPKARFDEQLGKERAAREAAERRAAELEAQVVHNKQSLDVQQAIDKVSELRVQERKALVDGNEEQAARLSAEADALNRQISAAEFQRLAADAAGKASEEMRMDMTLEHLEETYPMLRVGDDAYDQDLVDDILDKQAGLIARERLSPSKALAKAAQQIMSRQVAKDPDQAETATEEAPAQGLAAAKDGERKAAAVAKNLAVQQPGNIKDIGMASDKAGQNTPVPSAAAMEFDEFSALPESTRAKMRGDFV